jgi:hypothetical protein
MKVSVYIGISAIASIANGILILVFCESYNPLKQRMRENILYGTMVGALLLWSLWGLASSLMSSAAAGLGLPLLWLSYLLPNLFGTGSGMLLILSFLRRARAFSAPIGIESNMEKHSAIGSGIRFALGIADVALGVLVLLDIVLYSLGILTL